MLGGAFETRYGLDFATHHLGSDGDLFLPFYCVLMFFIHVWPAAEMMINAITYHPQKYGLSGKPIEGAVGGFLADAAAVVTKTVDKLEKPFTQAMVTDPNYPKQQAHFNRVWVTVWSTFLYILPRLANGILFILQFHNISTSGLYKYAFAALFLHFVAPIGYHVGYLAVLKNSHKLAISMLLLTEAIEIVVDVLFGVMNQWIIFGIHFIPMFWVGGLCISQIMYEFAISKNLKVQAGKGEMHANAD